MKGHPTLEVPVTCLAVSPYVDRYLPLLTTRRSPEDFPVLPPVGKVFGSQLEVPPIGFMLGAACSDCRKDGFEPGKVDCYLPEGANGIVLRQCAAALPLL